MERDGGAQSLLVIAGTGALGGIDGSEAVRCGQCSQLPTLRVETERYPRLLLFSAE